MHRIPVLAVLFFSSTAFYLGVAFLLREPGYMDACYYFSVAESIARGKGLIEPFLWNYLDSPGSIPRPAFTYWMPLPSLLAWPFLIFPGASYLTVRLPFIILASFLPLLSYRIAEILQERASEKVEAIPTLAAILTIFSGFYVVYWPTTDSFAPFALAGGLCLFLCGNLMKDGSHLQAFLTGVTAGLAHLARADGFLLLLPLALLLPRPEKRKLVFLSVAAYSFVMAPWFIRNAFVLGFPLPAWGAKTAFLTNYDDLFSYDKEISLRSYLAWGAKAIIVSKLRAGLLNFQTVLAVFLMIFLAVPFAFGLKKLYQLAFLRPFLLYAVILLLVMTLVFTYPGPRGSLFHSGGALLPFTMAISAVGIKAISRTWAEKRGLDPEVLWRLNFAAALFLAFLVTSFALFRAVEPGRWNLRGEVYRSAGAWLEKNAPPETITMVGDPPCFYYYTARSSIVIPNGDEGTVLKVARRYGASFLLLEPDHPRPLSTLYLNPHSHPSFRPVATFEKAILFRIEP